MGASTTASQRNRRWRTRSRVMATSAPSEITLSADRSTSARPESVSSIGGCSVGTATRGCVAVAERRGSPSCHPWWFNRRPFGSTFRKGVGFATRSPPVRRPSVPDGSMRRPGVNGLLRSHRRQCALHYVSPASHKTPHLGKGYFPIRPEPRLERARFAAPLRLGARHGGLHRWPHARRPCRFPSG